MRQDLLTMVTGIVMADKIYHGEGSNQIDQRLYQVQEKSIRIYLSEENLRQSKMHREGEEYAHMEIKVYRPGSFQQLVKQDESLVNIQQSFDIDKFLDNFEKSKLKADGGAGGAFFFFSYDNRLIFKSMTSEEKASFMKNSNNYFSYLTEHKNSLISKVYGLYKFQKSNGEEPIYIYLQRSICPVDPEFIINKFDLKGSSYNRQVIKEVSKYQHQHSMPLQKITADEVPRENFNQELSLQVTHAKSKNLGDDTPLLKMYK